MLSQDSSSWAPLLLIPFGLLFYVAIFLGVLWLATRIVRHAWYWQPSSASKASAQEGASDATRT